MNDDELKIPILPEGYVSVLRAKFGSGKIINNDDSLYEIDQTPPEKGGKIYYYIYRSYEEAKNDILLALKDNFSFEYIIHDNEGEYLECYRPEITISSLPEKRENIFVRLWRKLIN